MVKARVIDELERIEISEQYKGGKTAPQLAQEYNCSVNQIYDISKKYGGKYVLNQECFISERQHQILLGGWLGDGYFKRNGRKNVCYVECHAEGESEYLQWKHEELGELTENSRIYKKNSGNNYADAREFTTKTTPSLNKYKDYNRLDVIKELDELGLIIHLLDDGWLRVTTEHLNTGNYAITTYTWTDDERQKLKEQWYNVTGIVFNIRGKQRLNLVAANIESIKIYELVKKYIPLHLDICRKKFRIFNLEDER